MNIRSNVVKSFFCSAFLAGSVVAQPRAGVIKYATPSLYSFAMYSVTNTTTDCSNLNRLLGSYSVNHCGTDFPGSYCSSILAQIKTEQLLDRQNDNPLESFARYYRVDSTGNLPSPVQYSKRFDMSYADSYDFRLNAMEPPRAFRFEGGMTAVELDVEGKINADSGYQVEIVSGERLIRVASKIRVCALESGRISLLGKADMNVSTYHPVGRNAYDIVDETYRKAVKIATRTDLNDRQKSYLLGISAGESLKRIESVVGSAADLDEIALSLQNVILDMNQVKFKPISVDSDSNIAVKILDPGIIIPNAAVQIKYKVVSP